MALPAISVNWDEIRTKWPNKFSTEKVIFDNIRPGDRIFIGTACGEPQYLVEALINYIKSNPTAFYDAELIQVWSLGIAPYADQKFRDNFRPNSFFVGDNLRSAVNKAAADYTPVFLSNAPDLFYEGIIPIDVALIQTSLPDGDGNLSLGISVDMTKAAVKAASMVVAQVNMYMPYVKGDGILSIEDIDFVLPHDEPLLEYQEEVPRDIAQKVGGYVSRLIEDGSTIQVGYGSIPNAILSKLVDKKHLGLHSELFCEGAAELMKIGSIDNSQKSIDCEKAVASFCMGNKKTYDFLSKNPSVEFRTIDYTNSLLVIANQRKMIAINSALEIDLTGQATAESLGKLFYSGIGGQADFMRGAPLSRGGKSILAFPSTSQDGKISRIVPFLKEGAGVTLNRGDVRYVVTEYGIAYLHGKNIRERAMDLIGIAHPKFRAWLVEEAKKLFLIYPDQQFVPGEYPEDLEIYKTTKSGLRMLLRPAKISDESLLKDFFYSLSDDSMYYRFASVRKDMPHVRLQEFIAIDYSQKMVILAVIGSEEKEIVIGMGQYILNQDAHTAELALAVRDDFQNQGVGWELHSYLTYIAKRRGILGFKAEVLADNVPALRLLERMGFDIESCQEGVCQAKIKFSVCV